MTYSATVQLRWAYQCISRAVILQQLWTSDVVGDLDEWREIPFFDKDVSEEISATSGKTILIPPQ